MRRFRRGAVSRPVAAVVAAIVLAACAPRPRATPAPPAPAASSLLWRVTHGDAVSHLFGTIHVGRAVDDALGPAGTAALAGADTVVVEIDLDAPDTTSALADVVRRRGRLPAGRSLEAMLTPPTWRWLADSLSSQASEPQLRQLQPWLTVYLVIAHRAALALEPGGAAGRGTPPVQMDRVIMRRARARRQLLVALETPAEQVEALAAMPESTSVQFLEEVARDPGMLDRQIRGLVEGVSGPGAAAGVERMVAGYVAESPAMADAMFFDRNERWVKRLVPLLVGGDAFVAVGAGHLVGERGLVTLLRARGFEVQPLADGAR